jgi:hypothetical protein
LHKLIKQGIPELMPKDDIKTSKTLNLDEQKCQAIGRSLFGESFIQVTQQASPAGQTINSLIHDGWLV